MQTYLVTGAAGFIGANYIKYILKNNSDIRVVVLDALTYAGNLKTIAEDIDNEELNSLLTTITNQDKEIETKDLEITRLQAKIDKLEAEAAKLRERLTDSKKTVEKKSATKKASSKKATPQEENLAD